MSDNLKPEYCAKFRQWLRQWQENPQECSATLPQLYKRIDGLFNKVETVRAGLLQVEPYLAAQNGDVKEKMSDNLKEVDFAEIQQRLRQWLKNPQEHSDTLPQLYKDIERLSKVVVMLRADVPRVTPEQEDPDEHSATLTQLHEDIDGLSNYRELVKMGLVQVQLDLATAKGMSTPGFIRFNLSHHHYKILEKLMRLWI